MEVEENIRLSCGLVLSSNENFIASIGIMRERSINPSFCRGAAICLRPSKPTQELAKLRYALLFLEDIETKQNSIALRPRKLLEDQQASKVIC